MAKKKAYEVQGKTSTISARIKLTLKIGDHYASVEGCEERVLPTEGDVNTPLEWQALYDDVYAEVDSELAHVVEELKGTNKRRK